MRSSELAFPRRAAQVQERLASQGLFAGGVHWLLRDTASPQRCANPPSVRCINAKGIMTRSGEHKDAYHLFAAHYTECSAGKARSGAVLGRRSRGVWRGLSGKG